MRRTAREKHVIQNLAAEGAGRPDRRRRLGRKSLLRFCGWLVDDSDQRLEAAHDLDDGVEIILGQICGISHVELSIPLERDAVGPRRRFNFIPLPFRIRVSLIQRGPRTLRLFRDRRRIRFGIVRCDVTQDTPLVQAGKEYCRPVYLDGVPGRILRISPLQLQEDLEPPPSGKRGPNSSQSSRWALGRSAAWRTLASRSSDFSRESARI